MIRWREPEVTGDNPATSEFLEAVAKRRATEAANHNTRLHEWLLGLAACLGTALLIWNAIQFLR